MHVDVHSSQITPTKEADGSQIPPNSESSQAATVPLHSATETPTSVTDESAVEDARKREAEAKSRQLTKPVSADLITICPFGTSHGKPKHHLAKIKESIRNLKCSLCDSQREFNKVEISCVNTNTKQSTEKCSFNLCMVCYRLILSSKRFDNDVDPASDVDEYSSVEDCDEDELKLELKYEDSKGKQGSRFIWVSPYVESNAGTPHTVKYYPQVITISLLNNY